MDPAMRRQRRIGAATLMLLAAAIVLAQFARGRHEGGQSLDAAYMELAAAVDGPPDQRVAHVRAAERHLSRAAGAVVIDAEAIAALAVLEQLPRHVGEPAPPVPVGTFSENEAIAYAEALLVRGRTAEAVAFLRQPALQQRVTANLRILQKVATRWQAARSRPPGVGR
jgi:hypothetical protein